MIHLPINIPEKGVPLDKSDYHPWWGKMGLSSRIKVKFDDKTESYLLQLIKIGNQVGTQVERVPPDWKRWT